MDFVTILDEKPFSIFQDVARDYPFGSDDVYPVSAFCRSSPPSITPSTFNAIGVVRVKEAYHRKPYRTELRRQFDAIQQGQSIG